MAKRYTFSLLLLAWSLSILAQPTVYFPKSAPEAQSVVSDSILSFIDRVESEFDVVHSFMIVRNGYLVAGSGRSWCMDWSGHVRTQSMPLPFSRPGNLHFYL